MTASFSQVCVGWVALALGTPILTSIPRAEGVRPTPGNTPDCPEGALSIDGGIGCTEGLLGATVSEHYASNSLALLEVEQSGALEDDGARVARARYAQVDLPQRIELQGAFIKVGGKLGLGSRGSVNSGVVYATVSGAERPHGHLHRMHLEVAIKSAISKEARRELHQELVTYTALQGGEGIPRVYYYGEVLDVHGHLCVVLVMQRLDRSLRDISEGYYEEHGNFSIKTTVMVGMQLLERLKFIHEKGFLHRDVKPANFMTGRGQLQDIIYTIDVGLSTKYLNSDGQHLNISSGHRLVGTPKYVSVNIHNGLLPSRRDDLISLGYIMLDMIKHPLPWAGAGRGTTKKAVVFERIRRFKQDTPIRTLFADVPEPFMEFFKVVSGLEYAQDPPYTLLHRILEDLLYAVAGTREPDNDFDWKPHHLVVPPAPIVHHLQHGVADNRARWLLLVAFVALGLGAIATIVVCRGSKLLPWRCGQREAK